MKSNFYFFDLIGGPKKHLNARTPFLEGVSVGVVQEREKKHMFN